MDNELSRMNYKCITRIWWNAVIWHRERPFWGGLLTILSGAQILHVPYAGLTIGQLTLRMSTVAGSASLVIGMLLATLGLMVWLQPLMRVFAGSAAILLALVSIPMCNLGGLLIGLLLALVGAALSIAWTPGARGPGQPSLADRGQ
ncbi:DUF6114 domain-containing protein [Streptomyces collinus]|uniref:DUF6114 domain-containing protein n=1 Tax=Streptomyces collinus TaxID=42684 RepID=UPI00369836C2